jgi:hypothetical protein
MTFWNVILWIRLHWFELATLALLSLNLWLAFEVLSVLKAANHTMVLLWNWLDRARDQGTRESRPTETASSGQPPSVLIRAAHPWLATAALAALSWALLVALLVGTVAAIWAIL